MTVTGFDDFVRIRGRELRRVACLLTGHVADADDLLQAALLKVYIRWSAIEHAGDPFPYVVTALLNTRRSSWRRVGRREIAVPTLPESRSPDDFSMVDTRQAMWAALLALPRRQRATVVLRYYEDFTEAETARVLGCSVGTVKSQTAKAMATLRTLVGGELHPSGIPRGDST